MYNMDGYMHAKNTIRGAAMVMTSSALRLTQKICMYICTDTHKKKRTHAVEVRAATAHM